MIYTQETNHLGIFHWYNRRNLDLQYPPVREKNVESTMKVDHLQTGKLSIDLRSYIGYICPLENIIFSHDVVFRESVSWD